MKVVIDLNDRDYELLKNAGITIDFNTLFHGKEKDRELTFSTFNLIESLKNSKVSGNISPTKQTNNELCISVPSAAV